MINRTMFRNRGRAMAFAFALAASAALSACGGGAKQETTKAAESGQTQSAPASAEKGAENGPGAGSGSGVGQTPGGGAVTPGGGSENPAPGAGGTGTVTAQEGSGAPEGWDEPGIDPIDMTRWLYNEEDDVFYQLGILYCEAPEDDTYETLGYFVPGNYFDAEENGDGTWTCQVNILRDKGEYTADTAPVILPVNTPGYSAMKAPTSYEDSFGYGTLTDYTERGMIVAFAGCRGRDHGAPYGVTDLKAAIRYIRHHKGVLPGAENDIFACGMSGGGAQTAILGASGDSELYTPYLQEIGAVMDESDAVQGAMCWCPVTNLDLADEAYEWNMGASRQDMTQEEKRYSDGMAEAFGDYINELGLKDEEGEPLTLQYTSTGKWQSGSYYEMIMHVAEHSLENFLKDTTFPYDASAAQSGGPGGRGMGGPGGMGGAGGMGGQGGTGGSGGEKGAADAGQGGGTVAPAAGTGTLRPDSTGGTGTGTVKAAKAAEGETQAMPAGERTEDAGQNYEAIDNIGRNNRVQAAVQLSGTYETPEDYVAALNEPFEWVEYNSETGEVGMRSLALLSKAVKPVSKGLGAFDMLDASQGENTLFNTGDGEGAHFDPILAELAEGTAYETDFADDLNRKDELGTAMSVRVDMYNPLYYLLGYYQGADSSRVADYWRIRTGLFQSDTALTTEVNLWLALLNAGPGVEVDFETVWGKGHTMAERTGNATDNFIEWVNHCEGIW